MWPLLKLRIYITNDYFPPFPVRPSQIGFRSPVGGETGERLCAHAMSLGVRNFDTSLAIAKRAPPHPAKLAKLAKDLKLDLQC